MVKNPVLLKKELVIGICVLFISMSAVSSTDNIMEDVPTNYSPLEFIDNPKGLLPCDHIAYIGSYDFYDCWIYEIPLNSGDSKCICDEPGPSSIYSATCMNDERIMALEYDSGQLWEIEPENCETTYIGGGGIDLNGLAYDPTTNRMFGVHGIGSPGQDELYEIDPDTGEQEYIGDLGGNIYYTIGMAFDSEGTLYGWDVPSDSFSYLYTIDTETGEATIVAEMSMPLLFTQDGDFCKKDDILYLGACTTSGHNCLCICDKETGELTILGYFPDNAAISIFAIPWNFRPYAPIIIQENGSLFIYAIDPDGDDIFFLIDWGDGTVDDWIGPYPSGEILTINHEWSEPGTYEIRVKARDIHGAESDWSDPYIICIVNLPPDTPTIDGSSSGKVGVEYEYNFSLSDPNEDKMHLRVDWGSGTPSKWYGPFDSSTKVKLNYTWNQRDTFTIKAQAKDVYGAESNWSYFEITIPRTRVTIDSLFQFLFDRFPLLEVFLRAMNLLR